MCAAGAWPSADSRRSAPTSARPRSAILVALWHASPTESQSRQLSSQVRRQPLSRAHHAGVINASVAAKLTMHRIYNRNGVPSVHFTHNTVKGWITWIGIVASIWILGFLLAEVIPYVVPLRRWLTPPGSSATCCRSLPRSSRRSSPGRLGASKASASADPRSGIFWLHLNPRSTWFSSPGRSALASVNLFLCAVTSPCSALTAQCGDGSVHHGAPDRQSPLTRQVAGLYASIQSISEGYTSGKFGTPFTVRVRQLRPLMPQCTAPGTG